MIYCDFDFDNLISDKYFDYLSSLSPIKRAAEKFRLQLEEIPLHILKEDRIFGWFGFEEKLSTENFKRIQKYTYTAEEKKLIDFPRIIGSSIAIDKGHTCANYKKIINEGLISFEKQIDKELTKESDNEYLLAMKSSIKSVCAFSARMVDFIEKILPDTNGKEKERLIKIKNSVSRVPYYPAESFLEALQAVWIIHFLIPVAEGSWYSISLGSFDKYMYPYYLSEVQNGTDKQEIKAMLYNFYKLLNSYADGACLLNVGAEYNELSEILIECQKEFNMPAPILGARISENTPEDVFEALIDEKLFSMGQPTFYSEEGCIKALATKGVPFEDAKGFANNSCMGISMPGEEFNSMWGCVFNVCAALETTLNKGALLSGANVISSDSGEIESLEQLYMVFSSNCKKLLDKCLAAYELNAQKVEAYDPDVFLSAITDGCISKKCDRVRGAKYHNVTVECFGMINTSDGICAIDNLVFKQKKYTLSEIGNAIKNNFEGFEAIRRDILGCPKYGTNSEADTYAVKVAEILSGIIPMYDRDNYRHCPSLHTLDGNVHYGANWGASYDGRLASTPFAKNAGPCNEVRSNAPTSLILSAAKLPQFKFYGGQPVDIKFDPKIIRNQKPKIAALIKTYFQNGGLQLQVNALSSEILQNAINNPSLHNDLIVRVGGYSDYFNKFSLPTRKEFVERFKQEEKN